MEDVIKDLLGAYEKGREKWATSVKDSTRCLKFALGDQWTSEEKAYLSNSGRPDDVVYNKILPRLNNIIGIEQQNRRQIKIVPQSEKYDELSELVNQLFYAIRADTKLTYTIEQAFKAGLITTVPAWIEVGTELDKNGERQYTFELANSFMITPDPSFRDYYLRDCNWIIKENWLTKEDIEIKYNKVLKEKEKSSFWQKLTSANNMFGILGKEFPENEYYQKDGQLFKVLEMQKRVLTTQYVYLNLQTGEYQNILEKDKKDFEKNNDFQFVTKMKKKRIHVTTVVPFVNQILIDKLSELDTEMYNVIPYMSYDYNHIKSENSSFVNALIPIQKSYNKREVQYLAFLDHSINAPIFFHYADKETKEEYDRNGNKPNSSFLYRNSKMPPFRITPNQVPYSIKEKLVDDEANMNDISAVNDAMRGQSQYSEESGRLFNMKNQVAGVTVNHYFNNLSKTREMIGNYILDTLGYVYGEKDRIASIQNEHGEEREVILNMDMGNGQIVNNVNEFKGKIQIDEGETSSTFRQEKFMQKMALVNLFGIQMVNPEWLLKDSQLPDWQEQVQYMQQIMGIQAEGQARQEALGEQGEILNQLAQEKAIAEEQPSE